MLKQKRQPFGHLMWRANSLKTLDGGKDWEQEDKGQQRMRLLDDIIDSMDVSLSNLQEIVDREVWRTVVLEVPKSWTWLNNWTQQLSFQWTMLGVCRIQHWTNWSWFLLSLTSESSGERGRCKMSIKQWNAKL